MTAQLHSIFVSFTNTSVYVCMLMWLCVSFKTAHSLNRGMLSCSMASVVWNIGDRVCSFQVKCQLSKYSTKMNKPCHEHELKERKRVKIATADNRYISFEARTYMHSCDLPDNKRCRIFIYCRALHHRGELNEHCAHLKRIVVCVHLFCLFLPCFCLYAVDFLSMLFPEKT